MKRALLALGLLAAGGVASCRCSPDPGTLAQAPPGRGVEPWTGPTGGIDGEVDFTGPPPAPGKLHREADPYCARTDMTDPSVLVSNGRLANVWVRVVGAPPVPVPDAPLVIDQKDCMYIPRVATAAVGRKIVARNGDPVLHNVHAFMEASALFNRSLPNDKAPPLETRAPQPGLMTLKCDVHPWMRGYVGVTDNGLGAVSGADGAFHIAGVPPGRYTLEAWHETLGVKSQPIAVEAGQTSRAAFSY